MAFITLVTLVSVHIHVHTVPFPLFYFLYNSKYIFYIDTSDKFPKNYSDPVFKKKYKSFSKAVDDININHKIMKIKKWVQCCKLHFTCMSILDL